MILKFLLSEFGLKLSSDSRNQDEIDFEFLGHIRGELYILQTNIFTQGKGVESRGFACGSTGLILFLA